jgi:hypothetical protein
MVEKKAQKPRNISIIIVNKCDLRSVSGRENYMSKKRAGDESNQRDVTFRFFFLQTRVHSSIFTIPLRGGAIGSSSGS